MKFFTPDLLVRFGSEDDKVADAAQAEWEKVDESYRNHLHKLLPILPRNTRRFVKKFCLHDAKLVLLGMREDPLAVSLFLELDEPGDHGVLLHYNLARKHKLLKHPELQDPGTPIVWLYDEFDVNRNGELKLFTHSILFTGGWEVRLVFRSMRVELFEKVVTPDSAEAGEKQLEALVAG